MSSSSYGEEEDSKSGPVLAAIKSQRYRSVIPVHEEEDNVEEHIIKVEPYRQPVSIIYKTESNPVKVEQLHKKGEPTFEETESEDEPHRVTHKVFRPIIQEIKEIIQPYRRIRQEIRPVVEEVKTIVAKRDRSKESRKSRDDGDDGYKKTSKSKTRSSSVSDIYKSEDNSWKPTYKDESSRSDDNSSKYKVKYQSDLDSSNRKSKETRRYSRSRMESSGDQKQEENNDYGLRVLRQRISDSSDNIYKMADNSNDWKPKYQLENDSYNRKSKDNKQTVLYTDDITSVLEQMNSLLGGETKMRASQPSMLAASAPILHMNSGQLNLLSNPVYSGNLELTEDYLTGY